MWVIFLFEMSTSSQAWHCAESLMCHRLAKSYSFKGLNTSGLLASFSLYSLRSAHASVNGDRHASYFALRVHLDIWHYQIIKNFILKPKWNDLILLNILCLLPVGSVDNLPSIVHALDHPLYMHWTVCSHGSVMYTFTAVSYFSYTTSQHLCDSTYSTNNSQL